MLYTANNELHHDGKVFQPGDTVEMTEEQAAKVAGAVTPVTDADILAKASTKAPTAAELVAQIKAAATAEEVAAILGADQRKTVVDAATARTAELAQPE